MHSYIIGMQMNGSYPPEPWKSKLRDLGLIFSDKEKETQQFSLLFYIISSCFFVFFVRASEMDIFSSLWLCILSPGYLDIFMAMVMYMPM